MKIVLTLDEVGQILIDHLGEVGKLEEGTANLTWRISNNNLRTPWVEIEQ